MPPSASRPSAALAHDFNAPEDSYGKECDTEKIPVYDEIIIAPIRDCPKFRILIVGQTGVGKSTILSKVFKISDLDAGVSHSAVGTKRHQVWNDITFPGQNDRIIIHDSGGFESSDMDNMREVERFIKFRKSQPELAEQLHCIWYCISCRSTRPIQKSEKHFFDKVDVGRIPVVAVFTQFDVLVNNWMGQKMMMAMKNPAHLDPIAIKREAEFAAIAEYDRNYRAQLINTIGLTSRVGIERVGFPPGENDGEDLNRLVSMTMQNLQQEGLKTLWISAQRHSADLKLSASVDEGIQYFWRSVGGALVPFVPIVGASGLYKAFDKAFRCITLLWAIPDPKHLLQKSRTRRRFMEGGFNCTVGQRIGRRFLQSINIFGPLTANLTAATFMKMIVSITLIHELLFWREWTQDGYDIPLTGEDIDTACEIFAESSSRRTMIAFIEGRMGPITFSDKKEAHGICLEAVDIGRSTLYQDFTRKSYCISR